MCECGISSPYALPLAFCGRLHVLHVIRAFISNSRAFNVDIPFNDALLPGSHLYPHVHVPFSLRFVSELLISKIKIEQ